MQMYNVGDRVRLNSRALSASYIAGRRFYTHMYEGKTGTVICVTADGGKLGVEFDDVVFTMPEGQRSSHDNGCHGRGKDHYCWYIFPEGLEPIEEQDFRYLLCD